MVKHRFESNGDETANLYLENIPFDDAIELLKLAAEQTARNREKEKEAKAALADRDAPSTGGGNA